MLRSILAIILVSMCGAAFAQCDTIGVHIASIHSRGGYNDINPGLYARCNGWTFGAYDNSWNRASSYAGYTFESQGRLSYAVTVGGVTGYAKKFVEPMVVPSVAYKLTPDYAIRTAVMFKPASMSDRHRSVVALHFMLERHF